MRGNSNIQSQRFNASLSGEITQKNKSLDDDFLQANGQYVDIANYPDIGGMFPLSSTDLGLEFNYLSSAPTGSITAASCSGYIYAFNMHIYQNGNIVTSIDGTSMIVRYQGNAFYGFGYANNYCIIGGNDATGREICIYSTNGINWDTSIISRTNALPISCAAGNNIFMAIETSSTRNYGVYTSTNPSSEWIKVSDLPVYDLWPMLLCFANNYFGAIFYNDTELYISVDGKQWTSQYSSRLRTLRSINSGDGTYAAIRHDDGALLFGGYSSISLSGSTTLNDSYAVGGESNTFLGIGVSSVSYLERWITTNRAQWYQYADCTFTPSLTSDQQGDILGYGKDGKLLLYVIDGVKEQVSIYEGTAKIQLPNYADETYIRVRGGYNLIKLLVIILLFFHNERREK